MVLLQKGLYSALQCPTQVQSSLLKKTDYSKSDNIKTRKTVLVQIKRSSESTQRSYLVWKQSTYKKQNLLRQLYGLIPGYSKWENDLPILRQPSLTLILGAGDESPPGCCYHMVKRIPRRTQVLSQFSNSLTRNLTFALHLLPFSFIPPLPPLLSFYSKYSVFTIPKFTFLWP